MTTQTIKGCASIILAIFVLFTNQADAQQADYFKEGTIYLLRHAEKGTGTDPGLTQEGLQRSGDLLRVFKEDKKLKKPSVIFVTQYKRTQITSDSLRLAYNIDTLHYKADNNGDAFMNMLASSKEKNILVIGHSNTIPVLLKRLGVNDYTSDIPDNEYDNFFIIRFKKGIPELSVKKYGKASVPGGAQKMQPLQ